MLCLRRLRAVLIAESAFTLSHTLSFSASSLGWVQVSSSAAAAAFAGALAIGSVGWFWFVERLAAFV